jgi:hypothetical protein
MRTITPILCTLFAIIFFACGESNSTRDGLYGFEKTTNIKDTVNFKKDEIPSITYTIEEELEDFKLERLKKYHLKVTIDNKLDYFNGDIDVVLSTKSPNHILTKKSVDTYELEILKSNTPLDRFSISSELHSEIYIIGFNTFSTTGVPHILYLDKFILGIETWWIKK